MVTEFSGRAFSGWGILVFCRGEIRETYSELKKVRLSYQLNRRQIFANAATVLNGAE